MMLFGKIYKLCDITARSSFFTKRVPVVNIWNSLPVDRLFITSRFYSTDKQDGFSRI